MYDVTYIYIYFILWNSVTSKIYHWFMMFPNLYLTETEIKNCNHSFPFLCENIFVPSIFNLFYLISFKYCNFMNCFLILLLFNNNIFFNNIFIYYYYFLFCLVYWQQFFLMKFIFLSYKCTNFILWFYFLYYFFCIFFLVCKFTHIYFILIISQGQRNSKGITKVSCPLNNKNWFIILF